MIKIIFGIKVNEIKKSGMNESAMKKTYGMPLWPLSSPTFNFTLKDEKSKLIRVHIRNSKHSFFSPKEHFLKSYDGKHRFQSTVKYPLVWREEDQTGVILFTQNFDCDF